MALNDTTADRGALAAAAVYLRPQVLMVALLGFSGGLPLALSGATLAIWMADRGVSLETIGLFSLAGLPYVLKCLWAPLVDTIRIPLLSARLGRRRSWLIVSQILLIVAILFLATRDPIHAPFAIGLGAMLVATASATQDIVIDAFRIESLDNAEQPAGIACYSAGYRIAMLVSGAGVIGLTAWLETKGFGKETVWPIAYATAAGLGLIGMIAVWLAREPERTPEAGPADGSDALMRTVRTARSAFMEFLSRDAAVIALGFVVLFKLCDALAGAMLGPFVLAIGYDKATLAGIVKGVGLLALLVGGFAGAVLARMLPLIRALWLGTILQTVSNLVFVWLSTVPAAVPALTTAILIENFTGGLASVIFVVYLTGLCTNPAHTATQFALLTALAAVGRTLISSISGYAAVGLGWPLFFLATTAAALPSFMVLGWLQARGHFEALDRSIRRADRDAN